MAHRSRATTALLVAAMGLLIAAAPAGAYLRDLTVRQDSTGTNSNSPKRDLVSVVGCPGPIIGGGAFVSPALPNLGLNQVMPFGGLLTGASETDSEAAAWRLLSRAFCVANTGQTPNASGNPAQYLKALSYASDTSGNNSLPLKTETAKCPAGKTVIGGGARILAASSNFGFVALQRIQANTAWRAVAHEVDQDNSNWQLSALAICADVSSPSASANYVGNAVGPNYGLTQQFNPPTAFNSVSPKTLVRTCPPGSFVIGGGARVSGNAFSDPPPGKVVFTRSSLGAANQWIAEARETDPTNASWRLNAHVSCAPLNGAP
jgi:hypothetical protein